MLTLNVAFTTFLEWNSNPEIASVAEKLYGDIEYLELYVGLQAEEAKPLVDGAGLCPGTELVLCEFEKKFNGTFRLHHQSCYPQ